MLTVDELKSALRALGLPTTGRKHELEQRLFEAQESMRQMCGPGAGSKPKVRARNANDVQPNKHMRLQPDVFHSFFSSLSNGADEMDAEQTLAFCEQLGVDPEDKVAISLSYFLNSPSMGVFQRDAFVKGAMVLGASNIERLKEILPEIVRRTKYNGLDFDEMYKFVYGWACEPGIRNMKKDVALSLWKLLIPVSSFAFLDEWITFWEEGAARIVTRDEWNSFKRFVDEVKGSKTMIELVDDSWPIAIDDFVEKTKGVTK